MRSPLSSIEKDILVRQLPRAILIYTVIMFYCNIAVYLSLEVSTKLQPQYWLVPLAVFAIWLAILRRDRIRDIIRVPIIIWCIAFMALTLLLYIAIPESHIEQLKERVRDVILVVNLVAVFLILQEHLVFIRTVVLCAVLMDIAINIVSIVHANFLLPNIYEYAARPAGFYINPNESATAILFGMILTISLLPLRIRMIYAALVFAGIAATFSREAIACWFIIVVMLSGFRIVNIKTLAIWSLAFTIIALALASILVHFGIINIYVAHYYQYNLSRLVWFTHGIKDDPSVHGRIAVLKAGFNLFLKHPWLGNGIGSTEHWNHGLSTHNMYLYFMDDYGIIGLALFPAVVWAILRRSLGEARKIGWCMGVFLLTWGLFDHDVMRNHYSLFAIALMAVWAFVSKANTSSIAACPGAAGT